MKEARRVYTGLGEQGHNAASFYKGSWPGSAVLRSPGICACLRQSALLEVDTGEVWFKHFFWACGTHNQEGKINFIIKNFNRLLKNANQAS
jgi:hypothetical protein